MTEIYALKCPISGAVRYIGKANCSQKRLRTHIYDSGRRDTPLYRWMRDLLTRGQAPQVQVLSVVSEPEWEQEEIRVIASQKAAGAELLNVARGGNEPAMTSEQRSQNGSIGSASRMQNPRTRRIWEAKRNMGHAMYWLKKNGRMETYYRILARLKEHARKNPITFGEYLTWQ